MVSITRNLILIGLFALTLVYVVNGNVPRAVPAPDHSQDRRSCITNDDCTRGIRFVLKKIIRLRHIVIPRH